MKTAEIRAAVDAALAATRKFPAGSSYHVSPESALEQELADATGEFRTVKPINGPPTVKSMLAAAREALRPKGQGGPGRGQGRKAEDGVKSVERVTVQLTHEQREKVRRNGGSVWVRKLIDREK